MSPLDAPHAAVDFERRALAPHLSRIEQSHRLVVAADTKTRVAALHRRHAAVVAHDALRCVDADAQVPHALGESNSQRGILARSFTHARSLTHQTRIIAAAVDDVGLRAVERDSPRLVRVRAPALRRVR